MLLCSSSALTGRPFESAMRAFHEAGVREIDLLAINTWAHINPAALAADFDGASDEVRRVLDQYELNVRAMNIGLSYQMHDRRAGSVESNLRELEALCALMGRLSVSVAALQPLQDDPSRSPADVLADCVESLRGYYQCAESHGISLGIELHVNSPFESMGAVNFLLDKIPSAGVIYDPSHFLAKGMDLRDSAFIIDNAVHAHLRDAGPDELQLPVGRGAADFEYIIGLLGEKGYKGGYSIEYIDNGQWDALSETLKLRDMLQGILNGRMGARM